MVIISVLPIGIFQKNFERYLPGKVGGAVPIRFIPNKVKDHFNDSKQSTVKIFISSTVTKSLIFFNRNSEAAIEPIKVHKSIVTDKKLKFQYKYSRDLATSKKNKIKELDKYSDDKSLEIDILNSAISRLRNKKISSFK